MLGCVCASHGSDLVGMLCEGNSGRKSEREVRKGSTRPREWSCCGIPGRSHGTAYDTGGPKRVLLVSLV